MKAPLVTFAAALILAASAHGAEQRKPNIVILYADDLGYELPATAAEDSHNLLPLLKGEVEAVRTTHVHNTKEDHYAIRHGDWVLIDTRTGYVSMSNKKWEARHGYTSRDQSPVELYNLKTDLAQKHNVAAEHPEKVAELKALLKKIRAQGHSAPRLAKP